MNANAPAPPQLRCLLCGGNALSPVWTLSGADVRALWKAVGRSLSEEAFSGLPPDCRVTQFECSACGFRFFDPSLAGEARFYEELEQGDYYVARRPEFDFALDVCRHARATSVLDVGGGEGAFLDLARPRGMTTFALELNPRAAEISAGKGHRALCKRLENTTPADVEGGVDVLTLFQVVEHVPAPVAFVRQAATLVKERGFLVVAVPNNRGQHVLNPFDPANMPPHHVSRWRMRDLEVLGNSCGLKLCGRGGDILYGCDFAGFWLQHNHLAPVLGRPPHPGGEWLPHLLSFMYRKLGCRYYFPRKGLSIYVAYQKP